MFHRACIQLNLPEDIALQVDCLVYSAQRTDASVREAMHVQSISHWAPANIGPYSQATKVTRAYGRSFLWRMTECLVISIVPVEGFLKLNKTLETVCFILQAGDTIFGSGSIGLWPPTMTMIPGGISQEAPLSLQHVERVITALNPGESLQSIVHGFCFLTSPAYVPVAKHSWHQLSNAKVRRENCLNKGTVVVYNFLQLTNQVVTLYCFFSTLQ